MDHAVQALFARYERFFNDALAGKAEIAGSRAFYAPEFIASTPAGVIAGRNDDTLIEAMSAGYARYRETGAKEMRLTRLRLSPIDPLHGVAHVQWQAKYARRDGTFVEIDFEVHYLIREPATDPRIFGWMSGDEAQLLRNHGIE